MAEKPVESIPQKEEAPPVKDDGIPKTEVKMAAKEAACDAVAKAISENPLSEWFLKARRGLRPRCK